MEQLPRVEELPGEIGKYKKRICSTDDIFQIEYTRTQSFLLGRRDVKSTNPNDILIEAFTLNGDVSDFNSAPEKTEEDLLLQFKIKDFLNWEFRGTISKWFIPTLIMKWGNKEVYTKPIQFVLILNFPQNIYHIACVSSNLKRDLHIILNSIDIIKKTAETVRIDDSRFEFKVRNLTFSNALYIYTNESNISKEQAKKTFESKKIAISLRDSTYRKRKMGKAKPDFFISHDSRDKGQVARPLYKELTKRGFYVWLDETELLIGDSIQKNITKGIKECRFGIIILSKNLFENHGWADFEFQSIMNKHVDNGQNILLPIWHKVSKKEVAEYSPYLSDKMAKRTDEGFDVIADELKKRFNRYE